MLTEFYKKTDGYYNYACKQCHCKQTVKYQKNNKEKTYQYKRKYHTKIKGVYGIFDNECLYVGESQQLLKRIADHKCYIKNPLSSHPGHYKLYFNLQKHTNLEFRILEECDNHKEKEQHYIQTLKPKYQ